MTIWNKFLLGLCAFSMGSCLGLSLCFNGTTANWFTFGAIPFAICIWDIIDTRVIN